MEIRQNPVKQNNRKSHILYNSRNATYYFKINLNKYDIKRTVFKSIHKKNMYIICNIYIHKEGIPWWGPSKTGPRP